MNKILIIGFGSIGRRHFNILKELLPNSIIDVVTKQNLKNIRTFKSLYDVKDINIYDYFIIASETFKHYEQLKYIDSKVNNRIILVEKPLFENCREYKVLNNKVFIAYNLRYHPIIQILKKISLTETPIYTNVIAGQYLPDWRPNRDYRTVYSAFKEKGGGVLLDLSHEIDYVQWIVGNIRDFYAVNKKISNLEIYSDDIGIILGITNKNTIVNIALDYITKEPIRTIFLHTNDKTYIGDLIGNSLLIKNRKTKEKKFFNIDRNYTYKIMHQDIISGELKHICTFEEGLEVIKLISNIKEKFSS